MELESLVSFASGRLLRSLKTARLSKTLRYILAYGEECLFDWRYGTDTALPLSLDQLGVQNDSNLEHATRYRATRLRALRAIFDAIKLRPEQVVVDFGCGKGRVLLVASEFGVQEARGIEFSPALCAIARKNCVSYQAKTKSVTKLAVMECDALEYEFKDDENVIYMFNPFDSHVMQRLLEKLLVSLTRRKRELIIVYCNPVCEELVRKVMNPNEAWTIDWFDKKTSIFEVWPRQSSPEQRIILA